jgi:hypothetical protein
MVMEAKQTLPNSTTVLILGICSIVFGCFFIGLILGIIGISLSSRGRSMYRFNPNLYGGYGMLNAGYILSIIGTALGASYILYWLFFVAILGVAGLSLWTFGR